MSVTLTFPADTANVALARTLAAAMSARADLPIDQLEDVRLAVDEAVSQVILDAPADADVTCTFDVEGTDLGITISAPSASRAVPAQDTFSWTVLRALVESVTADVTDGVVTLRLQVRRHVPADA
jgi:serine/threonine-protein kinase RsbW